MFTLKYVHFVSELSGWTLVVPVPVGMTTTPAGIAIVLFDNSGQSRGNIDHRSARNLGLTSYFSLLVDSRELHYYTYLSIYISIYVGYLIIAWLIVFFGVTPTLTC